VGLSFISSNSIENILRFGVRNSSVVFVNCLFATLAASGTLELWADGRALFGFEKFASNEPSLAELESLLEVDEGDYLGAGSSFPGGLVIDAEGPFGGYLSADSITLSRRTRPLLLSGDTVPEVSPAWESQREAYILRTIPDDSTTTLITINRDNPDMIRLSYELRGATILRCGVLTMTILDGDIVYTEDVITTDSDPISEVVIDASNTGDIITVEAFATSVGEDLTCSFCLLR
jgi:hypothetical protein